MGAKETVLVCPILGEQRGGALAVICLNGSGEGGQQIAKRQVSHLVVLISRDPFLDSSDYEGADHGIADADARVRFRTDPCTGLRLSSQRSESSGPHAVAMLHGANFHKMQRPDAASAGTALPHVLNGPGDYT